MTATLVDAPLLATKLFVPPPRQNRVSRARLRDQLDAAPGGTVTLTSAAAGSGKSTLLADWAVSADKRVAWLSLDPEDDEPRRFLNYIIAALENAGTIASSNAFAGVSSTNPAAIDAVLTELLNAIAERGAAAVLVLDDYHVIEGESVHGIVQRIIDHLPPSLHLVIATRVDPPLALSRLRARHLLLEIRAGDLRFTPDEAARFFNDTMGLGLTDAQVAELEERTEGWAVGLQMAAISLRGQGGAKTFISTFSGSNRYVLDYLTEEVLGRQPPDVRSFLLETSILTQLAAPLCDAITGRTDSDRVLQQLDAANLFLIPLDDVRFWYRYHHLFASLLRHELDRSSSAEHIAGLHRRASAWYASNKIPEPALHHAVAARDDDRAMAIVSENARTRIIGGDGGTVVRWMAQLPRERVERDIDLLLVHALALTSEYQFGAALREVDCAERIIPAQNSERYRGAVLSLRGLLERLTGLLGNSVETLEQAMTLLSPDDFWFSMTSFNLGMAAIIESDLRKAEAYLRQATGSRDRPDGLLTAVLGQCYGGWCCLWRGFAGEALQMAREANEWIEAWDAKHATGRPLSSLAYALLADTHRMWNDLDRAREFANLAMESGRKGFVIGYLEGARVLTQVADEQGDWDAAIAAAKETMRGAHWAGNPDWLEPAKALEYRVLWRRGQATGNRADLDAVARWCEENGFLEVDRWRQHMHPGIFPDYSLMIAARVLLHQERYQEAQRLLDGLFDNALRIERVPAQISLLVLGSLAEAALGHSDEALVKMHRALGIASKPGFIRFFLDEGSAAVPLIERAAPRATDRDFALRVLAAFEVPVKPRPVLAGVAEPLSNREIEVLQLIAAGASNQAAARKLFVAPSTVKKHLENIYAKLGVGGRIQAVARARELQIL
ncbi:MAG TPA: LuxR C-terminal-related transcriptional regulator [Thermoanaerobaculia bacterium]|nr:LuxR C-terminal-related transcriptional regulator [Thermoanaerobaculia bacterium]